MSDKNKHLEPLWDLRADLVQRRRNAADSRDLEAMMQAQSGVDAIDRAIIDELKAAH
jgi:hypothetical protein